MSEHLIREAEYLSTLASIQTKYAYPKKVRRLLYPCSYLC